MTWIEIARVVAALLVLVSALRFCISYHVRTGGHWRRNPDGSKNVPGTHMMAFSGAFVLYFVYAVLAILVIPEDWRPYFGTVIFLSLAYLFWQRTQILKQAQREPVKPEEK